MKTDLGDTEAFTNALEQALERKPSDRVFPSAGQRTYKGAAVASNPPVNWSRIACLLLVVLIALVAFDIGIRMNDGHRTQYQELENRVKTLELTKTEVP
jgi:hypothetical protein